MLVRVFVRWFVFCMLLMPVSAAMTLPTKPVWCALCCACQEQFSAHDTMLGCTKQKCLCFVLVLHLSTSSVCWSLLPAALVRGCCIRLSSAGHPCDCREHVYSMLHYPLVWVCLCMYDHTHTSRSLQCHKSRPSGLQMCTTQPCGTICISWI